MIDVDEVRRRVAAIGRMAGDDEGAHSWEDALHRDVLNAIAQGAEPAAELAFEALKTMDIDFARWCA